MFTYPTVLVVVLLVVLLVVVASASRSGVLISITNCYIRLTLLTYLLYISSSSRIRDNRYVE